MRDIFLALVLVGLLPLAFRRPFLGALIFAVISLANPHRFTWGFAYSTPWAMSYAIVTILGLLSTRERRLGDSVRRYSPVLLYIAWMGVSTAFAMEPQEALSRLIEVAKVHLMCLVTLSLLIDWERVKQLVWVCVCSIAFYGLKGGLFTLLTGGQFLVWGPPESAIGDNNHLAVGLVMLLPLMYWLFTEARRKWLQVLVVFSGLLTAVSIFGSHSRSAFLGVATMTFFLLLKSRHKLTVTLASLLCAGTIASFMPHQYWERMGTIRTYEEDESATSRITVWTTAINVANDRFAGAGFEYYSPEASALYSPNPNAVHSAHSIYFQALGEHGWPGLILFVSVWLYIWSRCRRVIKSAEVSDEGRSQALLARMIQVSIVGLAVGGAFVNIGNWDMAYYIAITALAMDRLVDQQARDMRQAASHVKSRPRGARFGHTSALR